MITGHNTDTQYDGVVYHVQTEDGGKENPLVVTLVYRGGRILAAKKTSYADILGAPDLAAQVRTLLDKQHRMMLAAVNAGHLAEGGKLEAKAAEALRRDGFIPPSADPLVPPPPPRGPDHVEGAPVPPVAVSHRAPVPPAPKAPVPPALSVVEGSVVEGSVVEGSVVEGSKVEGGASKTLSTVEGSRAATHDEKSLDQVILEFLASELGKK